MSRSYAVVSEGGGVLLETEDAREAQDAAAQAAQECSWECRTPPAPDNEETTGRGNFRCGVLAAHGIHIETSEDGYVYNGPDIPDVPDEPFGRAKDTQHADWALEVVVDRGTGYLADGHDTLYYAGPEQTDTGWDDVLADVADGGDVVEATVRVLGHGRYSHLGKEDGYPMRWRRRHGF